MLYVNQFSDDRQDAAGQTDSARAGLETNTRYATRLSRDPAVPVDDGAADHLDAARLPDLALPATNGATIRLRDLSGLNVFYLYPMTGRPGVLIPAGWDDIPGARGCTQQACSFRDHFAQIQSFNAGVFGLSAQSPRDQLEAKRRLHLPYELLSDSNLELKALLGIPTFVGAGMELYRRITLIARDGVIDKIFYPVFPPGDNAREVIGWLQRYA